MVTNRMKTVSIEVPDYLTTDQITTAIKQYTYRLEYNKKRNKLPETVEYRKEYNKKRNLEIKKALELSRRTENSKH